MIVVCGQVKGEYRKTHANGKHAAERRMRGEFMLLVVVFDWLGFAIGL